MSAGPYCNVCGENCGHAPWCDGTVRHASVINKETEAADTLCSNSWTPHTLETLVVSADADERVNCHYCAATARMFIEIDDDPEDPRMLDYGFVQGCKNVVACYDKRRTV